MPFTGIPFRYTTGRAANIAALIWSRDRSTMRTSGTTLTAIASIADASYAAGRLTATEKATSGATGTGVYTLSTFPALAAGYYEVEVYDVATPGNASPSPSDTPLTAEEPLLFYWDGTDLHAGTFTVALANDSITSAKVEQTVHTELLSLAFTHDTGETFGGADSDSLVKLIANNCSIGSGGIARASLAADTGLQSIRSNTAQAGAAGSITLDASASSTTDFYKGLWCYLTGGTGVGQARLATAYNGTTKVLTIAPDWATNPGVSSTFALLSAGSVVTNSLSQGAIDQIDGVAGPSPGADLCTINIKVGGTNIENAQVWVTTDSAGTSVYDGPRVTDSDGDAVFLLDAGNTYYLWAQKSNIISIRGSSFVAVAD